MNFDIAIIGAGPAGLCLARALSGHGLSIALGLAIAARRLAWQCYEAGADALEEPFASDWRSATDQAVRVRAVVDQVATLTDASASRWHARWCGMLSSQL